MYFYVVLDLKITQMLDSSEKQKGVVCLELAAIELLDARKKLTLFFTFLCLNMLKISPRTHSTCR